MLPARSAGMGLLIERQNEFKTESSTSGLVIHGRQDIIVVDPDGGLVYPDGGENPIPASNADGAFVTRAAEFMRKMVSDTPARRVPSTPQTHQGVEVNHQPLDTDQVQPHAETQLRTASADARDTDQLPEPLAGALINSDDTDILGAGAGPAGSLAAAP